MWKLLRTDVQYVDGKGQFTQAGVRAAQAALVSGTSIKTVGGESLLGAGDIALERESYGVLQADYVLTSTTAQQKLFDWTTNGAVTLATGIYAFQSEFTLASMSATSGNAAFGLLGAGTATLALVRYNIVAADTSSGQGNPQISVGNVANDTSPIAAAGVGTVILASASGVFDVTAAGTLIPSISLATAAAAIVRNGSSFILRRLGPTGVATGGAWT